MIEYEDPDFRASKYPPNPLEVTYWIDLSKDTTGNVIRTYNPVEKRWIPLNRDYNKDQWLHIQELVDALGFVWDHPDDDVIELPDFSSNHYFKGSNITEIILTGDTNVYNEVVRLDAKIDAETERAKQAEAQELIDRAAIDKLLQTRIENLSGQYITLSELYTALLNSYSQLLRDVASLREEIKVLQPLADDLGL